MSEISTFRLYLLRAGYLLIAGGLAIMIFPGIVRPSENLSHMGAVVRSMLGAVSLLAFLGIRYPLKLLPLLFLNCCGNPFGFWPSGFGYGLQTSWIKTRMKR